MIADTLRRLLEAGGEPDDLLRATVSALVDEPGVEWAGVAFVEDGGLELGPYAGHPDETRRSRAPISFQGAVVGELWVDGTPDKGLLEQVAELLGAHVLIGWDTGGEAWEP